MKAHGIRSKIKRRFVVRTTDSNHAHPIAPNRLNRAFDQALPDRVCGLPTSRMCIPTKRWLYLAVVMDACSRKIIGWSMADHLEASLVIDALEMALHRRRPAAGLMVHSDRGVQYACQDYQGVLARNQLVCSMSRRGNCYDNAITESFHGTLKTEWVYHERYATREEARRSIFEFIEVFYNRQRAFRIRLSESRNCEASPQLIASPRPPFVGKVNTAFVLAFDGTDDLGDWYTNFAQGAAGPLVPTQYGEATNVAEQVSRAVGGAELTITGHSLGGGLASAAALATNRPAVTFNAAGLNDLTALSDGWLSYTSSMVNFSVQGEILSMLQSNTFAPEAFGTLYQISPAAADAGKSPIFLYGIGAVLDALG